MRAPFLEARHDTRQTELVSDTHAYSRRHTRAHILRPAYNDRSINIYVYTHTHTNIHTIYNIRTMIRDFQAYERRKLRSMRKGYI